MNPQDYRKRKIYAIEALATAVDPVHQGGETTGTTLSELRRELVLVNGAPEFLPVISANSLAHHLRVNCVWWVLDQIKFDRFNTDGVRAFKLLFGGGGRATKVGGTKYVDLYEEYELRSLFPTISLFGGTIGNRMEKGRVRVENVIPVCQEMTGRLPEWLHEAAQAVSVTELLQELSFSTAEPRENSDYRHVLDEGVVREYRQMQEERLAKNKGGSDMKMRHTVEAFAAGTQFWLGFLLRNPTPVEFGVFLGGLGYFHEVPFLGGKSNRGFGRVRLEVKQYTLQGFERIEGPLATENVQAAGEHLAQHAETIRRMLRDGAL